MAAARKPKLGPEPEPEPKPEAEPEPQAGPVVVDVDTLVARPDLGPGAATFVAAGDRVPPGLEHHPRRPAR